MAKFLTRRRLSGIGAILLSTAIGYLFIAKLGTLYLAPFYVVLIYVTNYSGARTGLIAAIAFSLLGFLAYYEAEPWRFVANSLSFLLVAIRLGNIWRKAHIVDTLNGNIVKLWDLVYAADRLARGWDYLTDDAKYKRVIDIRMDAADLTTRVIGWAKLAEDVKLVNSIGNQADKTQESSRSGKGKSQHSESHTANREGDS